MLSIIVPIYNAAPWLAAMLDSLYAQDFREREVILVDDGSTDGSGEIADRYARERGETLVVHQEHLGVSTARNRGLGLARGEYVAFPDADDLLLPGMHSRLMACAREERLDIAVCNARFLRDGRPCEPILRALKGGRTVSGPEWLRATLSTGQLLHAVWHAVYRRAFLRQNNLSFIPDLTYRQDVPWTTRALLLAERVRFIEEPLYLYRVHRRPADRKRWVVIARCYMRVLEALQQLNSQYAARTAPLIEELRWQIADQGLRIFHQTRRLEDLAEEAVLFREMRVRGTDRLIRDNAMGFAQKRRVLKRLAYMYMALAASFVLSLPVAGLDEASERELRLQRELQPDK